ncbi:HD domain-containing protein [Acidaminobacter sp. JC074]|uniref:bis(5'-nucleosyl)-tetraphosphatase (symmetrical) YqeK n=1 Tax=Acidaminobacter sp. JC074 TaxID=2530199 RepID=UPI001F0CF05D|nr:bis(5'-nucleosyl)-tetraphosphatase (symmetrical) YqeK [Acidaminobacter sp. JC074]MCH4886669.1 HD domain-containing protein [Acidaminobacter sp. JC074]
MIDKIREDVKNHLKPSRYRHTLGVCKLAVSLAKWYKIDLVQAETAALLHDYAKYASDLDILDTYKKHGRPISNVIRNHPNLGHGFVSAVISKDKYQVSDQVYEAILNHTFGRPGMSMLEKIIYLADSLEEGRSYEGIDEVRSLLYKDLNKALLKTCENTLLYELKRGNMIHEQTILMRNDLLEAK